MNLEALQTMDFGTYFRKLRISKGYTLRKFCLEHDFDPGNISKLERGIFPAPKNEEKLMDHARALGIEEGSDEWIEFFDLAAASSKNFKLKKIDDPEVLKKLPILFRTLDNKKITPDQLDKIIEIIKSS